MSGVCAKHHGYVQPGEVCPYCEPRALVVRLPDGPTEYREVDIPAASVQRSIDSDNPGMWGGRWAADTNRQSNADLPGLMCDHKNRSVNRDACEDCGLSGMAIMQQRSNVARQWMTGRPPDEKGR